MELLTPGSKWPDIYLIIFVRCHLFRLDLYAPIIRSTHLLRYRSLSYFHITIHIYTCICIYTFVHACFVIHLFCSGSVFYINYSRSRANTRSRWKKTIRRYHVNFATHYNVPINHRTPYELPHLNVRTRYHHLNRVGGLTWLGVFIADGAISVGY